MAREELDKLENLMAMSEAMLVLAEQGSWDEVENLELQRQLTLPDFSNTQLSAQQLAAVNEALERVMHINDVISGLSVKERDNNRVENRKMAHGKRAVNAYSGSY